jgi:dienelactone hydrolase
MGGAHRFAHFRGAEFVSARNSLSSKIACKLQNRGDAAFCYRAEVCGHAVHFNFATSQFRIRHRKEFSMKSSVLALLIALAVLPCAAQLSDVQNPKEQTHNDAAQTPPPWVASGQQVVQELAAQQFGKIEAQYSSKMAAANAPGVLAHAWTSVLNSAGAYQSIAGVRAGKVQNFNVVLFTCKFEKSLVDIEVVYQADGKIAGLHFGPHQQPQPAWTAPSYVQSSSFTEQPLNLVNGAFEMPGTLTLPNGNGPFPAVVLLQDAGAHDEDETIGANKPLKDLAWGLASHGIAVYRYMKRTAKYGAKSNADPAKLTVDDEVISDARVAVSMLAKQPKIDSSRIYIIGDGFGGYIAPRIAAGDSQIAGIVAMGANARPLEKDLLLAVQYIAKEDAQQAAAAAADKPTLAPKKTADAAPKAAAEPSAADEKTVALAEDSAKKIESPTLKPGDTVPVLGGTMPAAYWLDLRHYDPVQTAERLRIPLLILQGGRDFQVTPERDFSSWQKAFAHRRNVTLKLYPDLNHLFMFGTGPSLPADYAKPGHVDEQVITDIAAWISAGGKRSALAGKAN